MKRVLVVTRIFPNRVEPTFGPYNEKQLAALAGLGWDVHVISPVPWFPGASLLPGKSRASHLDGVPRSDVISGLPVTHPRYLHVPRLLGVHAPLYASGVLPDVLRLRGQFDVILSPFAYPDGVASIVLGRALGIPVVVKLHGGDMNVGARLPGPGRWIRRMFPRAARIVAVSSPLADLAVEVGVPRSRVDVVQDGVDEKVFHVRPAGQVRGKLGLDPTRKLIVYVGRLERRKGVYELMTAFDAVAAMRPDVDLVLVGDGDDTAACRAWAERTAGRARLTGNLGMKDVADQIAASDMLVLPSHAEGTPNVVIEALASGRPVVATRVGGIPDMVHDIRMGELVPKEDADALAGALLRSLTRTYDANEVVKLSGRGTWTDSARALADSLSAAIEAP